MARLTIGLRRSMTNMVIATLRVTTVFDDLAIPYFIGGSMAGIFYGEYRLTQDTDIVADIQEDHISRLVDRLSADFYIQAHEILDALESRAIPDLPADFRPCFNLIHWETGFKIDVFLATHRPFEVAEFQRRIRAILQTDPEQTAYIASAEDIILAKLEWHQLGGSLAQQQWRDVVSIMVIHGQQLDHAYLSAWATRLGLRDLVDAARAAGQAIADESR